MVPYISSIRHFLEAITVGKIFFDVKDISTSIIVPSETDSVMAIAVAPAIVHAYAASSSSSMPKL